MRTEAKPWEEEVEGTLNLASHTATALYGLTELAIERLTEAGLPLTGKTVNALASTFAVIVARVQTALGTRPSLQDGSHTRLRGALRSALGNGLPVPFGADQQSWDHWAEAVEKRVLAVATIADKLYAQGVDPDSTPWRALAVATAPAEAA